MSLIAVPGLDRRFLSAAILSRRTRNITSFSREPPASACYMCATAGSAVGGPARPKRPWHTCKTHARAGGSRLNSVVRVGLIQFGKDGLGQAGVADVFAELLDRREAVVGHLLFADLEKGGDLAVGPALDPEQFQHL